MMDSIGHKDTTLSLCHPCPPTYHHSTYTPHVRRLLVLICSFLCRPLLAVECVFFSDGRPKQIFPTVTCLSGYRLYQLLLPNLNGPKFIGWDKKPTLYHSNLYIQYWFYYMAFQYIKVKPLGVDNREHQEHVREHRPLLQTILQEPCHNS